MKLTTGLEEFARDHRVANENFWMQFSQIMYYLRY